MSEGRLPVHEDGHEAEEANREQDDERDASPLADREEGPAAGQVPQPDLGQGLSAEARRSVTPGDRYAELRQGCCCWWYWCTGTGVLVLVYWYWCTVLVYCYWCTGAGVLLEVYRYW